MFIDTHAHIYSEEFNVDLAETIHRAHEAGVSMIYMPNIDSTSIRPMLDVASSFPQCRPMMGLHPCYVKENWAEELALVEKYLGEGGFYGVGEIGIDLYWDKTFAEEQVHVFRTQLAIAREAGLPVAIHSREALDLTISMVDEMQDGRLKGIFHCFNGSLQQAQKAISLGFYLGVGGVITYKNAGMGPVFAATGMEKLVLETDAPYLSPRYHIGVSAMNVPGSFM
ncbi:MAG: TatD family hydrolase [Saprospiraceae bacterium]|nr:TatD family hydrolase [Saprospiraceae bacterium]